MGEATVEHLQLALARLDLILQRQVARQTSHWTAEDENQWPGLYLSPDQALVLLQRPFPDSPFPPLDDEQPYSEAIATLDAQLAEPPSDSRLTQLVETFGLNTFEQSVLLLCLATAYDGRYGKIIGFLHDDLTQKRPSIALALDLFAENGRLTHLAAFQPDAPLSRLLTLKPVDNGTWTAQQLQLDDTVFHWLLQGSYQTAHSYLHFASEPVADAAFLPEVVKREGVKREHVKRGSSGITHHVSPIFMLIGEDLLAQETAVYYLANGRSLLTLDLAAVPIAKAGEAGGVWETACPEPVEGAVRHLLRDALLTHSLPVITHWERCLRDQTPPPALIEALYNHPQTVFVVSQATWRVAYAGKLPARSVQQIAIPLPNFEQAERLLCHLLGDSAKGVDLAAVAGRFQLSSSQWQDVVRTAQSEATEPPTTERLFAAARRHSNLRLGELARKVTQRHEWDDLILPNDQRTALQELVAMVRERPLVLDTWQLGRKMVSGRGIAALFSGPPGTGKTMAAAIISRELGLDLYKIDLSTVVSKYIGETEKNLERIFREAETSNAVLFFDEADAIFGKRAEVRDAHDRYANIEVSYLLQRMEAYSGVAILATNLKTNLDEAFLRRLHVIVHFPLPQVQERLKLWETVRETAVPQADDLHLPLLAERFELAGGHIRNIIVQAAYLAASNGQQITTDHLLHATRRELQKMGRLVREGDLVIGE